MAVRSSRVSIQAGLQSNPAVPRKHHSQANLRTSSARTLVLSAGLVAGVLVSAAPLQAQFCFRGRPLPRCNSFLITDVGVSLPVIGGKGADHFTAELGLMVNMNERFALGGSALYRFGGGQKIGLKARVHLWLTQSIALEVAPGMLLGGDIQDHSGFTGHVGVSFRDVVGVTMQLEVLDQGLDREETTLYLGGKLGSEWGVGLAIVGCFLGVLAYSLLVD